MRRPGRASTRTGGPPSIHGFRDPDHHSGARLQRAAKHGVTSHPRRIGKMPAVPAAGCTAAGNLPSRVPEAESVSPLEQGIQPGKWAVGRIVHSRFGPVAGPSHMVDMASVLVVVAVDAKQLPVAAVKRIVVVVVIAMMDRELAQILPGEFTRTPSADPRIHLQRFRTIAPLALFRLTARFGDDLLQPVTAPPVFIHGALRRSA